MPAIHCSQIVKDPRAQPLPRRHNKIETKTKTKSPDASLRSGLLSLC
jgi:hypothetical protein